MLLRPEGVPDADPVSDRDELIHTQVMRRERIVDMSAHDYRLEPNVSFSPDGKWVFFVSNMHGVNHVYAVEVKRSEIRSA